MRWTLRAVAGFVLVSLALAVVPATAAAEGTATTRRLAVVVGANAAAPGRKPLRFAHIDARAVAQVLRDLGGFAGDDVRLLLDPDPEVVLSALDAALRDAERADADALVLFYYSGHADTAALYPGGRALPLDRLRERLEDGRAAMRIGIIDACRGGGWTGSKGLSESETFAIEQALDLSSQGSVLIASSSGLEDAHESVALRGSFFTHHWNAALRGAADRNADDRVTLTEAFEYARALTIRDTALHTDNPQHPSFRFNLRGRGDPLLAELSPGSSVIELQQSRGPLQIIHLGTGLLVVELPKGERRVRVSLAPGHYLVRRRTRDAVQAREVRLGAGRRVVVAESGLVRIAGNRFASKGAGSVTAAPQESAPPGMTPAALQPDPPSEWLLSFAWGQPKYHMNSYFEGPELESSSYTHSDTSWSVEGAYLMRHGRYLATRMGLGYARPSSYGDGALSATVGEMLSWPLVQLRNPVRGISPYAVEPYIALHLTERFEFETGEPDEIPMRTQLGLSAGVRLFLFYAQFGYVFDVLPRDVTVDMAGGSGYLYDPTPGPHIELGFRVTSDIF